MPAISLRTVLFPQPEGPTTDTNSPSRTSNDTFRRASTFPARDRYDFDKPLIEIALGRGVRFSSFAWQEVCIEALRSGGTQPIIARGRPEHHAPLDELDDGMKDNSKRPQNDQQGEHRRNPQLRVVDEK